MMTTASPIPPMSMAMTTRPRRMIPSATINLKLHTPTATTSLLLLSSQPTSQQIRMLLNRRALTTHTHNTILQTILLRVRTRLTNRVVAHMAIATPHWARHTRVIHSRAMRAIQRLQTNQRREAAVPAGIEAGAGVETETATAEMPKM
jgi:hypothetical protein